MKRPAMERNPPSPGAQFLPTDSGRSLESKEEWRKERSHSPWDQTGVSVEQEEKEERNSERNERG